MQLWESVKEWWARFRGRRVRLVVDDGVNVEPEAMRAMDLRRGSTLILRADPEENSITLDWTGGDSYTLTFQEDS